MKTKNIFQLLSLALAACAFALVTSCEGPQGPQGPPGADGTDGIDGINGTDGTDGVDGNAVCLECHNLATKTLVTNQYEESGHYMSHLMYDGRTVYQYAGYRVDCGKCHSDQGFIETQYTHLDTLQEDILGPQPIQCSTCHDFHSSLDFENEPNVALRTDGPVDLLMYRADDPTADPVTIDLGDYSNLCANCHQPRTVSPVDDGNGNAYISSSHYGPHHGPQSTTLSGLGAYEIGTGYPDPGTGSTHATSATCIMCHMPNSNHTFEPNVDGCNVSGCHGGTITTVTDNDRQVTFRTNLDALKTALQTAGLLDANGSPVVGTFGVDSVGAVYNYEWLVDDRSSGVHNFPYTEKMLENSLAIFN